jgi:signal transduction histidine kinase
MDSERPELDLSRFAGVIVHELRTPLSALVGEVEVALRRERSSAAYREVLVRVGALVEEIVELTGDLAAFANVGYPGTLRSETSRIDECLDVAGRYRPGVVSLALDDETSGRRLIGDRSILTRALTLLVDHAVRHRSEGAAVCLRSVPPAEGGSSDDSIVLLLEAFPAFPPQVWVPLVASGEGAPIEGAALLRLPAAARMIAGCGGSVRVRCSRGSAVVRIQLRVEEP